MNEEYLKQFSTNLDYHFSEKLEYPFAKPYWIYVSLSHKCTYNCQMCGVVKILKGFELPLDTIKKTFNEIASWNNDCVITLTGGEIFLRKDIFDIISYGTKNNINIEGVSNGSLITEELACRIVSSGLNNIAVSLDGAKKETHDFIRQSGAFRKAIGAIKNLVTAKKKIGFGPQISVWTTIMKENVKELFDIAPLVRDLGVECLVYHPVVVAQDDMQNTSPNAPFWIKGEAVNELDRQIDKIIDFKAQNGLVAFLHNPKMWVGHFKGVVTKNDWKCNPFVFINIGPDGEVRSCGASFGNIKHMSLNECLNTKEAHNARKIMKACLKPCLQTCWAHPESDSLVDMTSNFIDSVKAEKDKIKLLKEAIKDLNKYKNMLLDYRKNV